jgi:hypothetical protein
MGLPQYNSANSSMSPTLWYVSPRTIVKHHPLIASNKSFAQDDQTGGRCSISDTSSVLRSLPSADHSLPTSSRLFQAVIRSIRTGESGEKLVVNQFHEVLLCGEDWSLAYEALSEHCRKLPGYFEVRKKSVPEDKRMVVNLKDNGVTHTLADCPDDKTLMLGLQSVLEDLGCTISEIKYSPNDFYRGNQ